MLNGLISIILTGTMVAGGVGIHNSINNPEIADAKIEAVESLSSTDQEYLKSLDGKEMRDLTLEEKENVRAINEKVHNYMIENIEDEELKKEMEERHEISQHFRATRQMSDTERSEYISSLDAETREALQTRMDNHKGRGQNRNR